MKKLIHKIGAFALIFSFIFGISSSVIPVANAAEPTGVCKSTADTRVTIDAKDDIECTNKGGVWSGASTSGVLDRISNAFLNTGKSAYDTIDCGLNPWDCAARNFAATAATLVLKLASLLTMIGGVVLNGAIFHTVVKMSDNYRGLTVIGETWRVIRDIANMAFIFVLLYAAIQQILGIGKNVKELIVKIVVVAILINFSLFFTQFVIDISNLFTLTFYDAIVPNAASKGLSGVGLSDAFMKHLNLQNLYSVDGQTMINFEGIVTTGVMGSILLLISAFVFFAAGLMFIIRYVVLILVLILSPIAFIAYILPSGTDAEKYRKQWMDALLGQAFFAPIYMMLTWVTLKVLSGVTSAFGTGNNLSQTGEVSLAVLENAKNAQGLMSTFINFIVVIAFLIFSLVIAKDWASRTPGGVGKLTSWATGMAGGATFGLAARAGRSTIGAGASRLAQSERFQNFAARNVVGQVALNRTNALAKNSFDYRASRAGGATLGQIDAGKAQEGGYEKVLQDRIEKKEKFNTSLRSNASKEAYATRIARGPLTRGGSRSSANSILGVLGRQNRVVASKIFNDRATKLQTDINTGNTELSRYQNIINQYIAAHPGLGLTPAIAAPLALNPTQLARQTLLNGPVGTAGSLAAMQDNITNLQNQADTSGLNNLTAIQQSDNVAARSAGYAAPYRGTRADEQKY